MTIQQPQVTPIQNPYYPPASQNGVTALPVYPVLYSNQVQHPASVQISQPAVIPAENENVSMIINDQNGANNTSSSAVPLPAVNIPPKRAAGKNYYCLCFLSICCLVIVTFGLTALLLPAIISSQRKLYNCDSNPGAAQSTMYSIPMKKVRKIELRGDASFVITHGYDNDLGVRVVKKSVDTVMDGSAHTFQYATVGDTLQINVTGKPRPYSSKCVSAQVQVYLPLMNALNLTDIVIEATEARYYGMYTNKVTWVASGVARKLNNVNIVAEEISVTQLQARDVVLRTNSNYYSREATCNSCQVKNLDISAYSARVTNLKNFPSANSTSISRLSVTASSVVIQDAEPASMNLTVKSYLSLRYSEAYSFYGTLSFNRTSATEYGRSMIDDSDIRGMVSYQVEANTKYAFKARVLQAGQKTAASDITALLTSSYAYAYLYLAYKN